MPSINWYPGHIAKAERKLHEQTSLVDIIIEIIDARIPLSSSYIDIERITGNKPRLILMNKSDLADPELNYKWKDYLEDKISWPIILTSSSSSKDISYVIKEAIDLGKPKIEQLIAKGRLPRPIRAMVVGMPNVGKSSIINKLIKSSKAKVGAKAGITRSSQWIRVNPKLELMDTPGIIPMKLDNQDRAIKLAIVNSISENAYDYIEVAKSLIKLIYEKYPDLLKEYYKLKNSNELPTLEEIAKSRNWILSGGLPDINRCSTAILYDYRHGKIGRTTLDSVPES